MELHVSPQTAQAGDEITASVTFFGTGTPLSLGINLPAQVSAPLSITPPGSGAVYDPGSRRLTWSGSPGPGQKVSFSFPVTVLASQTQAVILTAVLTAGENVFQSSALFLIHPWQIWLPALQRR